jgi:hypothetical protein
MSDFPPGVVREHPGACICAELENQIPVRQQSFQTSPQTVTLRRVEQKSGLVLPDQIIVP